MTKIFRIGLFLIFTSITVNIYSQITPAGQVPGSGNTENIWVEQYCQLICTPRLLSRKVTVELDFGELKSIWRDNRMKDYEGKLIKFDSITDAANYLGKDGWSLLIARPAIGGGWSNTAYIYTFKKVFLRSSLDD